jgi:hypothetical protein
MSNYDISKLIPRCFHKKKHRVRQTQRSGPGSTSIQSGGSININGKEVEFEECEDSNNSRFTNRQLLSIIGFVTLTVCTTILEASGGDGGGLWILIVLWGMSLGNI